MLSFKDKHADEQWCLILTSVKRHIMCPNRTDVKDAAREAGLIVGLSAVKTVWKYRIFFC